MKAGHQGRYHALKYADLAGVELVAVVDIDGGRAARLSADTGAAACTDLTQMLHRVDVASVAVPVSAHLEVGWMLLDAGVHVLMEKPIARNLQEARALTELAAARGCALQIGHVERFNPAFEALRKRVRRPLYIEARRLGPFTARGSDADVVLDLMIHDIDLALTLAGRDVVGIEAAGVRVLSDHLDLAEARLRFAGGCVAELLASRASVGVQRRDALHDQILAFLEAVAGRRSLAVSGEDGVRALETAVAVIDRISGDASRLEPREGYQ